MTRSTLALLLFSYVSFGKSSHFFLLYFSYLKRWNGTAYCVPATVLNLYIFYLILTIIVFYNLHFTNEKTKVQRG